MGKRRRRKSTSHWHNKERASLSQEVYKEKGNQAHSALWGRSGVADLDLSFVIRGRLGVPAGTTPGMGI